MTNDEYAGRFPAAVPACLHANALPEAKMHRERDPLVSSRVRAGKWLSYEVEFIAAAYVLASATSTSPTTGGSDVSILWRGLPHPRLSNERCGTRSVQAQPSRANRAAVRRTD